MSNIRDRIKDGRKVLEQVKRALPATQASDLRDKTLYSRFGYRGKKSLYKGKSDKGREYVAIKHKGLTLMLLNQEEVSNLINALSKAESDFDDKEVKSDES